MNEIAIHPKWPVRYAITSLLWASSAGALETPPRLDFPAIDVGTVRLEARRTSQLSELQGTQVIHDFAFSDRRKESGIEFLHRATDDGGRDFKMVHYDHGNGLAVADVDGDRLLDLYFINQIGANELWRNLGGGKFESITERAGVAMADRVSVGASFADVDNDGDPDLFVTTVKMGNVLFENRGQGRFRDVSRRAGVDHVAHSSGAVFFDYDRDGLLDLFVANVGRYTTEEKGRGGYFVGMEDAFQGHRHPDRSEPSILYRNLGGLRFEDVSAKVGLVDNSWSGDASPTDLNGDGYPDLYVLNMQGDDHYYENVAGERFVDRTAEYFPKTPWGAMGVGFFDYNRDGRFDLLVTDMHSDMSIEVLPGAERQKSVMMWDDQHLQGGANNIFGNALYQNTGKAPFEEVSDVVGAENYWPWGLSIGDLNADGYEDVFIASSMSYPFRYGLNSVLLNDGGEKLRPSELALGVEPRSGGMAKIPLFEIDCSRDRQPMTELERGVCGQRKGTFTVHGNLGTRTTALVDLDQDGDLDIVTGEFNSAPQILMSDLASRRSIRFLKVALRGIRSNRDGLGAVVTVATSDASGGSKQLQTMARYHDGKSGYLSQSSLPLYFGLGASATVTNVEIRWPSGEVQSVTDDLAPNQLLYVVEPAR